MHWSYPLFHNILPYPLLFPDLHLVAAFIHGTSCHEDSFFCGMNLSIAWKIFPLNMVQFVHFSLFIFFIGLDWRNWSLKQSAHVSILVDILYICTCTCTCTLFFLAIFNSCIKVHCDCSMIQHPWDSFYFLYLIW